LEFANFAKSSNTRRKIMPVSTAVLWLKAASAVLMIIGGVVLALGALPASAGLASLFADLMIWPFDGTQSLTATETRFFAAIGGGAFAGWGVLVWLVAGRVLPHNPALGREILIKGFLTWFAIDSTFSVLAGAPLNALANAALLAVFFYPLWRMERQAAAAPQLQ
jgi:hypothetical protein